MSNSTGPRDQRTQSWPHLTSTPGIFCPPILCVKSLRGQQPRSLGFHLGSAGLTPTKTQTPAPENYFSKRNQSYAPLPLSKWQVTSPQQNSDPGRGPAKNQTGTYPCFNVPPFLPLLPPPLPEDLSVAQT